MDREYLYLAYKKMEVSNLSLLEIFRNEEKDKKNGKKKSF